MARPIAEIVEVIDRLAGNSLLNKSFLDFSFNLVKLVNRLLYNV